MEIKKVDLENKQSEFQAWEDGEKMGFALITWQDDQLFSIDATEVEPNFRGKGVAKKLVLAAIDFARAQNAKIIPVCSYAVAIFGRMGEKLDDVKF